MIAVRPSGDRHWTRAQPERIKRGTASHAAKLTETQIAQLCAEFERNRPAKAWLARKYGVSRVTVWRHLREHGLA